jgi:CMP/dCMP kinase
MIIAVDGPAASGKGTLAKGLARHYGVPHLDTGLLYRAVGLAVREYQDGPDFDAHAIAAAQSLDYDDLDPVILAGPGMGPLASKVSTISGVREALYEFQREFATRPEGAVLDGRDIGTKIAPEADVKLFIQADSRRRAERRGRQFERRGEPVDLDAIQASIEARDARDRENPFGGFYPADDAHLLDTTELSIDGALRAAVAIVDEVMARKAKPQSF